MGAAPGGKPENKVVPDAAAWVFNIVTSVGIIMVNKALMGTHGFGFVTTLPGIHFATTALVALILKLLGYLEPSYLPLPELMKYVLFANISVVGMNASLMWNSVGFYQISKLSMVPVLCMLEVLFENIRYSRDTKLSIIVVLVGVAICTVTDVSVNTKGLIAAAVAVCSTAFQQHFFIALSCMIAIGTNLSQFICIGRFTAVSFQVLGHMKTILVLTLGFILFGREGLNVHVAFGMILAIVGMIWYNHASSRPGGKECQDYREPVQEDIEQVDQPPQVKPDGKN
ncbi:hypothetical protein GQ55_7G203500 [Panicum hallii var. hallii]|uniref:Sugar phosphate transporter domain-containing protein n=1 Tax=Panicum hallii var. hallii TaxID=1504633 RepID=A0A2T7CX43_9POAL|nr:hypothetical protein GQ55_7G203500 [Panicum hallii var. hallii]